MKKPSYQELELRIEQLEHQIHQQHAEGSAYKRYQELVQYAPVCIHEINTEGKLVKMNPAGLAMLGLQEESEVINTPYLDFVGDANLSRIQGLMQHALEGNQASHFQFLVETPAGIKSFDSNFIPMSDNKGRVHKLMGVTRDITLEHESEAQLLKAKRLAEQSSSSKSAFLANISHELRTPINGILGASQLLNDEQLTENQNELVEIIYSSSDILIDMVNDLLDISSLEVGQGRLHIKPIDLPKTLSNVFNLFKNQAAKKSLDYAIKGLDEIPQYIQADALRITQMVQNIIANALKFTDKGHIHIDVSAKKSGQHQQLIINISDTGLGIPENQQDGIFKPFTQLDMSISKRQEGAGLGLAICKELCQLMQGSISLKSSPGIGTKFTIQIPIDLAPNTIEKSESKRNYQKSILLVEDNAVNQKVIGAILKKLGLTVTLSHNGQEALDVCSAQTFDLILMDIQMPIMDGLCATEFLRSRPNSAQTPIIALTASATFHEQLKCTEAGMNGFLPKPVRRQQIIQELDNWF